MSPVRSPSSGSAFPVAISKKRLPSSAVWNTNVDVWKIGDLIDPSDHSGR